MKELLKNHWAKPVLIAVGGALVTAFNVATTDEGEPKTNTQIVTDAITLPYRTAEKVDNYRADCLNYQRVSYTRDSALMVLTADVRKDISELSKSTAVISAKLDGLIEGIRMRQDICFAAKNDTVKPCNTYVIIE